MNGFSLHAAVGHGADERQLLEQLCRYIARLALIAGDDERESADQAAGGTPLTTRCIGTCCGAVRRNGALSDCFLKSATPAVGRYAELSITTPMLTLKLCAPSV